jgi:hypothetical protein
MDSVQRQKHLESLERTTRGYRTGDVRPGRGVQVWVCFPDVHAAASWAKTFGMSGHVVLDNPLNVLDAPVSLAFSIPVYAERMGLFISNLGKPKRVIHQPGDEDMSDEDYELAYRDGCP